MVEVFGEEEEAEEAETFDGEREFMGEEVVP